MSKLRPVHCLTGAAVTVVVALVVAATTPSLAMISSIPTPTPTSGQKPNGNDTDDSLLLDPPQAALVEPDPIISDVDFDSVSGTLTMTSPYIRGPVTTNMPTFGGKGTPNGWVYVADKDTGYMYCNSVVTASGDWSCKPTSALANGLHTIIAFSGSATVTYTVIISDPTVKLSLATPADFAEISTKLPVFSGLAKGSSVVVEDLLTGQLLCTAVVAADGSWSCTTDSRYPFPEGVARVSVSVYDKGWAAQDAFCFVVDASGTLRSLTHTFDVVLVSPIGTSTNWYSYSQATSLLAAAQTVFNRDLSANWKFQIGAFTAITSSMACNNGGAQWAEATAAAAKAAGRTDTSTAYYSTTPTKHLVVLENNDRDCHSSTTGFANTPRFSNVQAGGLIVVRVSGNYSVPGTFAHEFGHNLGMNHSQYKICESKEPGKVSWDMRLATQCRIVPYADTWDVMGGSTQAMPRIALRRNYDLGLWGLGSNIALVDEGVTAKRYTLALAGSSAPGVQSLLVDNLYPEPGDPNAGWYYGIGYRADASGKPLGVVVTRTNLSEQDVIQPAGSRDVTWGSAVYLQVNDPHGDFYSAGGALRIHVVSMSATQAVVEVTRAQPPTSSSVPVVRGSAVVGATLTASVASRTPAHATITWQWLSNGSPINGATGSSYTVAAADKDKTVTVKATVSSTGYAPSTSTSVPVVIGQNLSDASGLVSLFRFYNYQTDAHFYTVSESEKNSIIAQWDYASGKGPFSFDGSVGRVVSSQTASESGQLVVYRFYRPALGVHFYTADQNEMANIRVKWPDVFTYEGPVFVVYARSDDGKGCAVPGTIPVFRFLNHVTNVHFYTADPVERDSVIAKWDYASGRGPFALEGIAYCIIPQ